MSIELFFYLADLFENISSVAAVILIFIGISMFFSPIAISLLDDMSWDIEINIKRIFVYAISTALICALIAIITPSKKTMYLMVGAHYLKKSDIPTKVELVINKKLDEYLKGESK